MKNILCTCLVPALVAACGSSTTETDAAPPAKVYVAVEDASELAVLDGVDLHPLATISLGGYMAHNVQVAPDGKSVWLTLVGMEGMEEDMPDQVVVVDPTTDSITDWVELGVEVHPAHVALTPDSETAFVTGAENNELIKIDVASKKISAREPLGHGAGVHGTRVSRDGRTVWSAQIEGQCVAKTKASELTSTHVDLDGLAVQVGVTLDDRFVFASLYDAKQVARIDRATSEVTYAALPRASQGPVQLYPTPDGGTMLVADQGVLYGRAPSDKLYAIDIGTLKVTHTVKVGLGAHGVVASGDRAYVTAIEDDTVTAVDLGTWKVVGQATVGSKPNGISVWTVEGGTP